MNKCKTCKEEGDNGGEGGSDAPVAAVAHVCVAEARLDVEPAHVQLGEAPALDDVAALGLDARAAEASVVGNGFVAVPFVVGHLDALVVALDARGVAGLRACVALQLIGRVQLTSDLVKTNWFIKIAGNILVKKQSST